MGFFWFLSIKNKMRTIKFTIDDANQKQFSIALKNNVNHYFKDNGFSKKGDYKMFLKAIIMLSLYLVPFILLLTIPMHTFFAFLIAIMMGIGEAGFGMSVMHDAAHGSFSKKNWLNQVFSSTIFLLGTNELNWKIQHNYFHHMFTNIYGYDEDIETAVVIRLSEHAPLKKYHQFQYLYAFLLYGLLTLSKLVTDFGQLMRYNKLGITKERNLNPFNQYLKMIIAKMIYLFIIIGLPLMLTDFTLWQIIVGFVIMHVTAGMIMSAIFQMAHVVKGAQQPLPDSDGKINNEWGFHQLLTTSNFAKNNKFLCWYIGGLNFQIVHHLYPNVCHLHYPAISNIVEQTAHDFGYTCNINPTFIDALFSHITRLKELGK